MINRRQAAGDGFFKVSCNTHCPEEFAVLLRLTELAELVKIPFLRDVPDTPWRGAAYTYEGAVYFPRERESLLVSGGQYASKAPAIC